MAQFTLAELLKAPTSAEIYQRLLASLGPNFPVTDWEDGGVERTMIELEADSLTDLIANGIPTIVGGGFLDYSNDDWLTFLAAQLYELERFEATFTQETEVLTSTPGTGPLTFTEGQLIFQAASGNLYFGPTATLSDPGPWTLPDGDTLAITIQSEFVNDSLNGRSYTDGAGTITTLQTQFAGVTCNNPALDFAPVLFIGAGTGTITPTPTGGTPAPAYYDIQITTSGNVADAFFQYRQNGGPWQAPAACATPTDLPGGTTITFVDGAGSPSFVQDDLYTVTTPGSPITQQGTDEESDISLRQRCRARWPDLSLVPTDDKHKLWAKQASTQVTRVHVAPSDTVPGGIDVVIAGQAGPLSGGVVNAVQVYLNAREGIGYIAFVTSATGEPITCLGTVIAPANLITAIQAEAQDKWQRYVTSVDIAGEVRLAKFEQIIMDAGATDVSGLSLNGNGNVVLTALQVATFSQILANVLTWQVG